MTKSIYQSVYLYDNIRQLMVSDGDDCLCKDNGPMNLIPMKIHRGIDNKLIFRVLTPNRKPYDIACNYQVYARLLDSSTSEVIFEKLCRLGPATGVITVEVNVADISNISAGRYNLVLVRTNQFVYGSNDYIQQKPVFSDFHDNMKMEVEVTDQAMVSPTPSIQILPQDWTLTRDYSVATGFTNTFTSQRIPAGRLSRSSYHTFSTYTDTFTGVLEVWGTLSENPDTNVNMEWFLIPPSQNSNSIQYITYTGTKYWTIQTNVMWIKFRLIPSTQMADPGKMLKLLVR